jgi:hypothetical protein
MRILKLLFIFFSIRAFAQETYISKAIRPNQRIECSDHDPNKTELKRALFLSDSLGISTRFNSDKIIIKYSWPLKWVNQTPGNSFYSLSNYFENDPSGLVRDCNCGKRSYNGHIGTDIYPWPAWWLAMDNEEVDVVAGAGGRIINKIDGNFDRNCVWGNQSWNAVYLQHPGGSVTYYGHLKKNRLTNKIIGDSISEGEFLGKVGSSGRSTGPHLHFEVYEGGNVIDPYKGQCNANEVSHWKVQHPYYNQAIIRSFCTSGEPVFPECPQQENLKKDSLYAEGDSIYLTNYYRDLKNGDTTILILRNPEGDILDSLFTIHDLSPDVFYDAGGWLWKRKFNSSVPHGNYTFESRYRGNTLFANFKYDVPTGFNPKKNHSDLTLFGENSIKIKGVLPSDEIELFNLFGLPVYPSKYFESNFCVISNFPRSGSYLVRKNKDQVLRIFILKN